MARPQKNKSHHLCCALSVDCGLWTVVCVDSDAKEQDRKNVSIDLTLLFRAPSEKCKVCRRGGSKKESDQKRKMHQKRVSPKKQCKRETSVFVLARSFLPFAFLPYFSYFFRCLRPGQERPTDFGGRCARTGVIFWSVSLGLSGPSGL